MVAGLKFLSKKSFNPKNSNNQKTVWERQQEREQQEKMIQERERELQRERDDEELQKARGDVPRLGFLYAVPPGLEAAGNTTSKGSHTTSGTTRTRTSGPDTSSCAVETHRQPGDDEAAAAFRALLASSARAASSGNSQEDKQLDDGKEQSGPRYATSSFGTVLQGTSHDPFQAALEKTSASSQQQSATALSALEKAVGRKQQHAVSSALTLDEQIQRFPALANAPRQRGISSSHVGVNFQPLGSQIRNVKCMACGLWGHSRGERECQVSGWNPFDAAATRGLPPTSTTAVERKNDSRDSNRPMPSDASSLKRHNDPRHPISERDKKRRRRDRDGGSTDSGEGCDNDSSHSDGDDDSRDRKSRHHLRKKKHKSKHNKSRREHKQSRRRDEKDNDSMNGSQSSSSSRRRRKKHRKRRDRDRRANGSP